MGALKLATMDEDGLYDRVHRLHYNAGQSRTDHFAQAGAALGAAAALALRSSLPAAAQTPTGIMGAAAVGVASGVVLHILTAPKAEAGSSSLKHKWQKMTHEVMTK